MKLILLFFIFSIVPLIPEVKVIEIVPPVAQQPPSKPSSANKKKNLQAAASVVEVATTGDGVSLPIAGLVLGKGKCMHFGLCVFVEGEKGMII